MGEVLPPFLTEKKRKSYGTHQQANGSLIKKICPLHKQLFILGVSDPDFCTFIQECGVLDIFLSSALKANSPSSGKYEVPYSILLYRIYKKKKKCRCNGYQ